MAGSGLATVMFTDLVGSTRMREQLGDDVADEIGVEHDRIIGDALSSTGGRLVKNLGDGALAVFDSSVDAVVAGQRIQEGVSLYNRQADESRQIGVRIGINAGEIATDDNDVIGLPVAIASRVCDKADGGQILITDTVRTLIGRRARFPYVSIGAHLLKGVDGAIELWSIEDSAQPRHFALGAEIPFPAFLTRGAPLKLVGRDDQLAQLDTAYIDAAETVELVAIIGEPGIGKTSLTSTWCRKAAGTGARVVAGRCIPDAPLPYQPFVEIARVILGARPELLLDIGPAAGNIAQLVPGIEAPQGLPVPIQTDPDTTRYLMAEAFAALLEPGEGEPPTVVVLDDLHWADEHSIAVLSHLVRRDELSALIIGTYRDTDLVRGHSLPKLLTDLRRQHRVVRIPLQRLSDEDVEEMISGHFGSTTAPDIIASIAEETQGNPFFVEEITIHLQDEGAIDAEGRWISDTPIDEYGIPEGLREVVGRRIEHLGEDTVSTLEVAAVIGPEFSIDVAGSIAGLDDQAIDAVVDKAMNARLIREGDRADEFSFSHALLRQTLYDGLHARRRIRLHRKVGESLETRGEPAAVVLNHWLNANDSEKALASALAAATSAKNAFAGSDALAHLELALDIWADVEAPEEITDITHAQLVMQLTDTEFDFGSGAKDSTRLIKEELRRDNIDDTERALLLSSLSLQQSRFGRLAESRDAQLEALRLVPTSPPNIAHAEILASHAASLAINGEAQASIPLALEALELARSTGGERAELAALQTLAVAQQTVGASEESNRYYSELRELADKTGILRFQLIRYVNQGSGLASSGYLEDALRLTEEGIARTSDLGVGRWETMLRGNAAQMAFDLGRWNDAQQHLVALDPGGDLDFPQINHSLSVLRLAAERGDDRTTRTEVERLGPFVDAGMDPQMQGFYWECRVSDLRWHGHLAEAYRVGSGSLDVFVSNDDWMLAPRLAAYVIEAVADAADLGQAKPTWIETAQAWRVRFAEVTGPMLFRDGFLSTAAADLSRAEGDNDPDLWRKAVDSWGDQAYYGAKARWRLARSLAESDAANPEITELLNEVQNVAERLEALPLLGAVAAARENVSQ
jgi:class 3 adenylate cyclase